MSKLIYQALEICSVHISDGIWYEKNAVIMVASLTVTAILGVMWAWGIKFLARSGRKKGHKY
jgi:hypothetical protein